jgi:methionyl-tRNA formyltransferase
VTTFFLQQSVDTGNIITMDRTAVGPDENASELLERLSEIGAGTVERTLEMIASGTVTPQKQNDRLATRAPKLTRQNTRIDWHQPVHSLHDFIRGLSLKPAAWSTFGGKSMKFYRSGHVSGGTAPGEPGTIRIDGGRLLVSGTDGWLELRELQPEGKKVMDGASFARGLRTGTDDLRFL